jgi:hypothetical protein
MVPLELSYSGDHVIVLSQMKDENLCLTVNVDSGVSNPTCNYGTLGRGERTRRNPGVLVVADPQPLHDFGHSAALVLPANNLLAFARRCITGT